MYKPGRSFVARACLTQCIVTRVKLSIVVTACSTATSFLLQHYSWSRVLARPLADGFAPFGSLLKVTGYLELYDFIYVYIYAPKTGILKS